MHSRKWYRKRSRFSLRGWSLSLFWIGSSLWGIEGEELKEVELPPAEPLLLDVSELREDLAVISEEELIALSPEWSKMKIGFANSKTPPPPPPPLASKAAPHVGIDFDALYFEPIQAGLKYGQTNSMSFTPSGKSINQPVTYKFGFRGSALFTFDYENWGMNLSYTYFHPNMPTAHKTDANQYLYMILTASYFPQVNNFYNVQCGEIKGNWQLKMDVLNAEFKKTWFIDRSFVMKPFMGIQAAAIKQRVVVHYNDIYILNGSVNELPIVNPQKIVANSRVYAMGPDIGSEFLFIIPKDFSVFFKGLFSCMFGTFRSTTKGTENLGTLSRNSTLITTPYQPNQVLKDTNSGSFTMMQIQAALSKQWKMGKKGSGLIMVGWETQFWWSLAIMNGFNEPDLTSIGADLSLQGPFGRLELNF